MSLHYLPPSVQLQELSTLPGGEEEWWGRRGEQEVAGVHGQGQAGDSRGVFVPGIFWNDGFILVLTIEEVTF